MNSSKFQFYLQKYAIFLIIFFIVELLVSKYRVLPFEKHVNSFVFMGFFVAYNLFLAILVAMDQKKEGIKSILTIIAIVFFNLFGICFFLLNVMNKENEIKTEVDSES